MQSDDPLAAFHPAVADWFRDAFPRGPTAAQVAAWPAIAAGRDTLVAAPTGSGKTLTAFMVAIDGLIRRGLAEGGLPDAASVVYVSPLKALSNDIRINLEVPLAGIRAALARRGLPEIEIRTAVRTGDTPARERLAAGKRPPHLLVTTPESLYVLLGSAAGRALLQPVGTVIVDEIHAVAANKRGSHLALSLERLAALTTAAHGAPPVRIGVSATQKPIDAIAGFLVGSGRAAPAVVDIGYAKTRDLALEVPPTPLSAVMSTDQWEQVYGRLTELVLQHRTTLVFVNTRRMAERAARHLAERLGRDDVAAHHGSLAREARLDAEQRLKRGELKVLVATASLELGLDIGDVELVCQLGSPRAISTFLQRAGRSGHAVGGVPKARLFPQTRDELVECAALLDAVRRGELDALRIPCAPLDVLAQQIVAEVAARSVDAAGRDRADERDRANGDRADDGNQAGDGNRADDGERAADRERATDRGCDEDTLYALVRRAAPYAELARGDFDAVVRMLADGVATQRGARGSLLHRDAVHRRLRAKRGARLTALTSGGTIPETGDYTVLLEPEAQTIGTVNEDFAIESLTGDVFQLGNASYRILRIEPGRVRVADAQGAPPNIPFWLGEAPGRSDELSAAVSRLREAVAERPAAAAAGWLTDAVGLDEAAVGQMTDYLRQGLAELGTLPTQRRVVFERFFDESGGMQLVIHAPFGSRINRAWGLALRKRFCRRFNFELQAAATEDAIVLSLSTSHSFALDEVARYLHPASARDVLIQALLDAPMFGARWRWNATNALALPRFNGGRKVAPQLQRMRAEDLLAAVFPDQVACAENLQGDREVPDHPLVAQTLVDCLHDAMDVDGWLAVLRGLHDGTIEVVARDLAAPSPFAAEVINARPYAFLDDAPLEERRTQAVQRRRFADPGVPDELGRLDPEAIAAVRQDAWPDARDADEMHEALAGAGALTDEEVARTSDWAGWLAALAEHGRATRLERDAAPALWVATERLPLLRALLPDAPARPEVTVPAEYAAVVWKREDALRELIRARLAVLGPVTVDALARPLGLAAADVTIALQALQAEGFVLCGRFGADAGANGGTSADAGTDARAGADEWCERHLLARIHRATLTRLRREIEPVEPRDFQRFLFGWQHLTADTRVAGPDALAAILTQLEGYEAPAVAWENELLAARVGDYTSAWLDDLCTSGRITWTRLRAPSGDATGGGGSPRATPLLLLPRRHAMQWARLAPAPDEAVLGAKARRVVDFLAGHGASFFDEIADGTRLLKSELETALAEAVMRGRVHCDSFFGLRALLVPPSKRVATGRRRRAAGWSGVQDAGRWALVRRDSSPAPTTLSSPSAAEAAATGDAAVEHVARTLLRRYGVVCWRLTEREAPWLPPWRRLVRVYQRLEARGEIRGGRFIAGVSGEQYALPEAVAALRRTRRTATAAQWVCVGATDPANLVGTVLVGPRLPRVAGNRVVYRDGVAVATQAGDRLEWLVPPAPPDAATVAALLRRGVGAAGGPGATGREGLAGMPAAG
ncbi:MAG: DEAD/DEAH box helicase [Lautropia sp.]